MSHSLYWLQWVVVFLGVVAVLAVGVAIEEWWIWRKEKRRP